MPTVLRIGRFRFHFYSDERGEPPHIHVASADGDPGGTADFTGVDEVLIQVGEGCELFAQGAIDVGGPDQLDQRVHAGAGDGVLDGFEAG